VLRISLLRRRRTKAISRTGSLVREFAFGDAKRTKVQEGASKRENRRRTLALASPSYRLRRSARDAKQHERFGASHLSRRSEGHLSLRYTSLAEGEEERLGVAESNPEMRRDSVHSLRRCTYGARDAKANSRYPEIF
jgi:hypothetical protein